MILGKVISGAQTGADRGGLIGAKRAGIATGGFIPKGAKTELGSEPELIKEFSLWEHSSANYPPRTRANVSTSDATLLMGRTNSRGTALTIKFCKQYGKPYIDNPKPHSLAEFIKKNNVYTLNVAGNRESKLAGIQNHTAVIVEEAINLLRKEDES
jgi:hypothetical protein